MIVDEADVLCDEGPACAAHLRAAHATRAAVAQAIAVLRDALHA